MKIILTETQYKMLLMESTSLADDPDFQQMVKDFEGSVKVGDKHITYDDATGKKVTKGQTVSGTLTIGYGTTKSIHPSIYVGETISETKAVEFLKKGIEKKENVAREKMSNYDTFPKYVRMAILNAMYRGDLGPKTITLINQGKWSQVSKEYLDHPNYTNPGKLTGVVSRMKSNADAFDKYAQELKTPTKVTTTTTNDKPIYETDELSYVYLGFELDLLTKDKNYKVHHFPESDPLNYRLEVGPYPPPKREGRYLVFFRNGNIKWYDGDKFSSFVGSWGYDTMNDHWKIVGKNGWISMATALNQPHDNFG